MDFVAVEAPTTGVAFTRETLEFLNAPLGIISTRQGLQVVADELIQTLAKRLRLFSSPGNGLLVN
jgi:hypothetical protein